MEDHVIWVEKYRPHTVEDCILPKRLKVPFQEYVNQKMIPNLMLSGGPGIGKTTAAMAMCDEIGCDYLMINGSDEGRQIETCRTTIKRYASSMSLMGGRKVIIIDEADYMNAESVQPQLRGMMEEFASNCSFIFTCNYKNRIIAPLHSRCAVIDFTLKPEEKEEVGFLFYKRIKEILDAEKVEYNAQVVAEVIKKFFPDFRRTINELQRYSKFGKIDIGVLAQVGEIPIAEIMGYIKAKDFGSIRKWVATNDVDATSFFHKIYEAMYDYMKPESIPQTVLILADYGHRAAFVQDQEINTMACLTELMINVEFK